MSFLRKGILVSAGRVLQTAAGLLVTILFARSLGPGGLGQYELFRNAGLLAVTFAALGFGNASIFFINNQKFPAAEVATNTLKFALFMGLFLWLGLATAFTALNHYFGQIAIGINLFFALGAAGSLVAVLMRPILVACLRAREMVYVDLIQPAIALVLGGGLALMGWLSTSAAMVIYGVSCLATAGTTLAYMRDQLAFRLKFDWQLFWRMIVYGLKLAAANLLYLLILQISILLLRYFHQESFNVLGLYSRAVAVASLTVLVPMAMGQMLMAKWSGMSGRALAVEVEVTARVYFSYGLATCVLTFLAGKYILLVLYGAPFATPQAAQALRILTVSSTAVAVGSVYTSLLAGTGRAMITMWYLLASVLVSTIASYLLIPKYVIFGASVATCLGNLTCMMAGMLVCRRLYGARVTRSFLLTPGDVRNIIRAAFRRASSNPPGPRQGPNEGEAAQQDQLNISS